MASAELTPTMQPPAVAHPPRESTSSWPLADRIGYWLCWIVGIGLCVIAFSIVLYVFLKGVSYIHLDLFTESPAASLEEGQSGGFLDPIIGTLIVTTIGIGIAVPVGVGLAAWMSEYGRPTWLARGVELGLEMIAGVPSIVLAIFGLLIFSQPFLGFLSQSANDGSVTGQSFLVAGIVMAVLALPLPFAAARESLAQLPGRMREASFALGKTRATTIRRVLLPAIRPGIASGAVLGMGRIIGDTAIILILLGGLRLEPVGHVPLLRTLRGTGSTLTSYVYQESPTGEGNAPHKAMVAAFVLLMIVLVLNAIVTRIANNSNMSGAREVRRTGRSGLLDWVPWTR